MFSHIKELFTRPSGYTISRSVRLRSSASAYFNRTFGTPTNNLKWTWSAWIKRGAIADTTIFSQGIGATNTYAHLYYSSTGELNFRQVNGSGTVVAAKTTSALYRDYSAWYHVVLVYDSANATSTNRLLLYVNGIQVTAFSTSTDPSLNLASYINSAATHRISSVEYSPVLYYFDGYLTEINFIDGQALTPSSFGSTNAITGVWQPAKYTGTYGTNGFYLNFSDNSSNTATTIGKDYSGNGNNWTPNNISVTSGATYDSMLDVPTPYADGGNGRGNYCVGNPLDNSGTLSSGNLTFVSGGSNQSNRATFQLPSSGKFYAECTLGTTTSASVGEAFGYATASASLTGTPNSSGKYVIYADSTGSIYSNGSTLTSSLGTFASGTILQIAYDGATGNAWVGKNNTWYNSSGGTTGDPSTGANPTFTSLSSVFPFTQGVNATQNLNFGQQPFTYTPPSGFVALNTQNLPASTITNGAKYMDVSLWTGTSATQTITNGGFYPDFLWIKSRSAATDHTNFDSVRGTNKVLNTDLTSAEYTPTANTGLSSFNSNGFTLYATDVSGAGSTNFSPRTYVGWQWNAGSGSSSSNTNGSITSTVSVGATQGFSVVTYTGTGANATVGHGLGVAPSMIIVKNRNTAGTDWGVYHASIGATQYLLLDTTAAAASSVNFWNNTSPTSNVFSVGVGGTTNNSGSPTVAYCFSAVKGFSAFGSYTGNGSTDGPFVYTGFRPRWVMIKQATVSSRDWIILDTSRNTYNVADLQLLPNTSEAENTTFFSSTAYLDILSNGFKVRNSSVRNNENTATYIYAAFAESPFKTSLAR